MKVQDLAPGLGLDREHILAEVTDAMPGFVWVSDDLGGIRVFNEAWYAYTGMTEEQSLGSGWIDAVHPDDLSKVASARAGRPDRTDDQELALRFRGRDGVFRWHQIHARRFRGALGLWIGCSVDITARVAMERAEHDQRVILEMVATGRPVDETLQALCAFCARQLPAARGALLLLGQSGERVERVVAPALPEAVLSRFKGLAVIDAFGPETFSGSDLVVRSTAELATSPLVRETLEACGTEGLWLHPVRASSGRLLGLCMLHLSAARAPTAEERRSLGVLRHLFALAVERSIITAALSESEEHHRHAVELNPQIPWTADPEGRRLSASSRWSLVTGLSLESSLGWGWIDAVHPDDQERTLADWRRGLRSGEPVDLIYRLREASGGWRWFRARGAPRRDAAGRILRWYGTLEDVHEHRRNEERLRRAAFEDALTGLPNRRVLEHVLRTSLDGGSATSTGLLILDIDDFKQVNDDHGHAAGDAVLRMLGRKLGRLLKPAEHVARLGGDEFAMVLADVGDPAAVEQRANALVRSLNLSLRRSTRARGCRVSAGCVLAGPGDTPTTLFRKADLALHAAKAERRIAVRLFTPAILAASQRQSSELDLARRALEGDWILPYYQPKVLIPHGSLYGFEALLRINHPERGILGPGEIESALEHPHLGGEIGKRMICRVLTDLRSWEGPGASLAVAVNLSSATLSQSTFGDWLTRKLARNAVAPRRLILEITERVLLDDITPDVMATMERFRSLGIGISLDDFGTGYASLTHLQQFPVTEIKIDRSFMEGLTTASSNAAIVKAMISLGQTLGLSVVAEGVQSAEQGFLLRSWGCQHAQGFHYGRPMPRDDAERLPVGAGSLASVDSLIA